LVLIITYKLTRAGLSFLGALMVVAVLLSGRAAPLQRAIEVLHDHAVHALSLWVTSVLVSAARSNHLVLIAGGLVLDATVLSLEGWALLRAWRGAVWLVVVASAALMPLEIVAFARKPAIEPVIVLAINALIVGWLSRRALVEHRAASRVRHPQPSRDESPASGGRSISFQPPAPSSSSSRL